MRLHPKIVIIYIADMMVKPLVSVNIWDEVAISLMILLPYPHGVAITPPLHTQVEGHENLTEILKTTKSMAFSE